MDSQDGARRKLKFTSSSKTAYYLDISSSKLRMKTVNRILALHGKIEEFLSKDVNLVLTDKNAISIEEEEIPSNTDVKQKNMPLSRGKFLLMKAAKTKNLPNDPIRYAHMLGVNIQKVSTFLKNTEFVKENSIWNKGGSMTGIQPIPWSEGRDSPAVRPDKAHPPIVKCEDTNKNYKPLIKLFNAFPQAKYNAGLISPFDKTVVLCRKAKENVNRYAVHKQSVQGANKAGYCESCDYWFKHSLRQHLNSEKHLIFTTDSNNYRALDEIMEKMPSVETFIKKFSVSGKTTEATATQENPSCPKSLPVVSTPEKEMPENKETELNVFDSCSTEKTVIKTTVSFNKQSRTKCCEELGFGNEHSCKEDLSVRLNLKSAVKDTTSQQSADTTNQLSTTIANQHSADTTNQHSADKTNQQSIDTTNQQSEDTTSQHSADTINQQLADTTKEQLADTAIRQSVDTTSQQSADSPSQQSVDTTNQQTATAANQLSADTTNQQTATASNQHSATASNQHSADTTNQQTATASNQHSADTTSQQTATASNQHSADTTSQQTATASNQHSADTTNQQTATAANHHSADTTNQQSATAANHYSADTTNRQTATTSNQHSADTTNQQTATAANHHSADTTNQQSTDTANHHSADTTNQQSADTANHHSADTTNQQSADTANQQSADTANQQSVDTTSQHSADSPSQSTDKSSQKSADKTTQHSAMKDTISQQSADSTIQHAATTANQHSAEKSSQQSADTTNQQSAGTPNQHSPVKDTTNQQSADKTSQQSTVKDKTNEHVPVIDTDNELSPVKVRTNQQSPVKDTTNQQSEVRNTANQHLPIIDTANQQSPVKDTAKQQSPFKDTANQQSPFKDTANQQSEFRNTANQDSLVRNPTFQGVSEHNKPGCEETTLQRQDDKFSRRIIQSDIHFSPIHSPNYEPDNLSFTELANRWMADIKSACTAEGKTTKTISIQEHHVPVSTSENIQEHHVPVSTSENIQEHHVPVSTSENIQEHHVPVSTSENILENEPKSVSGEDCEKSIPNNTYTVSDSSVDSISHLTSVNPVQHSSKMDRASNTDIPCKHNEKILNKESIVVNNVSKENFYGPITNKGVHPKSPVSRKLSHSPCVGNSDNIPPLNVSEENKENHPTVPNDWEAVQEPINDWEAVQEPINDWEAVQEPINDWEAVQEPINDWEAVQEPINDWEAVQEPINDWEAVQEPINDWEAVQEPIKIKISLSGLKDTPGVQVVKPHRKYENNFRGTSSSVYCAVQQSDMKLKLCKVKVTPVQRKRNLHFYWNVRKSGGCRLVFSAEKRKASDDGNDLHLASKRKRMEMY